MTIVDSKFTAAKLATYCRRLLVGRGGEHKETANLQA
jgi:hypothetical protein